MFSKGVLGLRLTIRDEAGPPAVDRDAADALVPHLIAAADGRRDGGDHRDAAALYREALRLAPGNAAIHIQCGHMLKEAGELDAAETHYLQAKALTPDDPDLALQLGHFYKVAGRPAEAATAYERAIVLSPGWAEPHRELRDLEASGFRNARGPSSAARQDGYDGRFAGSAPELRWGMETQQLVPQLVPRDARELVQTSTDSINLRQFGREAETFWGKRPLLRGIEALRGFCISTSPIVELQILLNGLMIDRGPLKGPYELEYEGDKSRIHKYVFNVWYDFSGFLPGQYELELRFTDADRSVRSRIEAVVVGEPLTEDRFPESDAVINVDASDQRSLGDQINARPSMFRPAERSIFRDTPKTVLILRIDQLGDLVTSIPAMRRLRQILPESRLVGLLGPSNSELASTLGLFDEIIVADIKESQSERRRVMLLEDQAELRAKLQPYGFDWAIDLAPSWMSRRVLQLSGAPFLYGFDDDGPQLSASVKTSSRDPKNGGEVVAHSTRISMLIENLALLLDPPARVIRRPDLDRERLLPYGLSETDRYVVLHPGARIEFSRWPYYDELAELILDSTDLKVRMFADANASTTLARSLQENGRFGVIQGLVPFDDFDALLSFSTAFVGNDSGPKHLAALRGANVISIHSARINWSEWGQEMSGLIASRKVPCAGCTLYHDADECGKDYVCVTRITAAEVFSRLKHFF